MRRRFITKPSIRNFSSWATSTETSAAAHRPTTKYAVANPISNHHFGTTTTRQATKRTTPFSNRAFSSTQSTSYYTKSSLSSYQLIDRTPRRRARTVMRGFTSGDDDDPQLLDPEEENLKSMNYMADQPVWQLRHMKEMEAAHYVDMDDNDKSATVKERELLLNALIAVFGADATTERLARLDRKEIQRVASAVSTATGDTISTTEGSIRWLIHQFDMTAVLHRVMRRRKREGKSMMVLEQVEHVIKLHSKWTRKRFHERYD